MNLVLLSAFVGGCCWETEAPAMTFTFITVLVPYRRCYPSNICVTIWGHFYFMSLLHTVMSTLSTCLNPLLTEVWLGVLYGKYLDSCLPLWSCLLSKNVGSILYSVADSYHLFFSRGRMLLVIYFQDDWS
jgi:hypothetical protein